MSLRISGRGGKARGAKWGGVEGRNPENVGQGATGRACFERRRWSSARGFGLVSKTTVFLPGASNQQIFRFHFLILICPRSHTEERWLLKIESGFQQHGGQWDFSKVVQRDGLAQSETAPKDRGDSGWKEGDILSHRGSESCVVNTS